ncbi:hypothetical protein D3C84_962480 [compost metagenome]
MLELSLFVLDVGEHLAHEMRLVDLGKPLADTIGAVVEAKRYRDCHRTGHAAVTAGFAQVLEQNIATQGIAHHVQRR